MPNLDPIISQYVAEGLHCFSQRLFFAAAVMFGAAAEKAVLILLQSITDTTTNAQRRGELANLLDRPRLPSIFESVRDELDRAIRDGTIPYEVHKGSKKHVLSLFETIRVQRNDAVLPQGGQVEKTKGFLTIQSFPAALELAYRLTGWFEAR